MVVFEIHFDRQIVDCVPFETEFGLLEALAVVEFKVDLLIMVVEIDEARRLVSLL